MFSRPILGIRIDSLTNAQALEKAAVFLSKEGTHTIFTPNPEMLVKAQSDSYFKEVLNKGSLNICDGFGISLVSFFHIKRIAGVDFMLSLCALAEKKDRTVFLLGSGDNRVVQKAAANLQHRFPRLQIVGLNPGPTIIEVACHSDPPTGGEESLSQSPNGQRSFASLKMTSNNASLLEEINATAPAILFVAFGMGKQEKWIQENIAALPSVKIAMGVGGSFDYLAGVVPRAPRLMRVLGLEWLYRLVRQPERFGRIWNATVKFLFLYFFKS